MCLYPRLLPNPKYKTNKKNGGIIPPVTDPRVLYVPTGCGNCIECRKQKAREWQVRLLEDIKTNTNAKVITLTLSNESYAKLAEICIDGIKQLTAKKRNYKWNMVKRYNSERIKQLLKKTHLEGYHLDNKIATIAVRRFLERWRKEYKTSLRHWLVTELGHNGTENIHLHGIIWTEKPVQIIDKFWKYGWTYKGNYNILKGQYHNYVNRHTIGYIVKYVNKIDLKHKTYKSLVLTSPGIGNNYTTNEHGNWKKNKFTGENTDDLYRTSTGHKMTLPIYWRNKIYTEQEKEELWLIKLNKQTRYILGTEIDISKNYNAYYKVLEIARKKNDTLGYGSNKKNWSREEYERQIRIIKQQIRIQNAFGGK